MYFFFKFYEESKFYKCQWFFCKWTLKSFETSNCLLSKTLQKNRGNGRNHLFFQLSRMWLFTKICMHGVSWALLYQAFSKLNLRSLVHTHYKQTYPWLEFIIFLAYFLTIPIFVSFLLNYSGLDETCRLIDSMGGWCRTQLVDISNRHEVYKAAAEIKNNYGDVSWMVQFSTFHLQNKSQGFPGCCESLNSDAKFNVMKFH